MYRTVKYHSGGHREFTQGSEKTTGTLLQTNKRTFARCINKSKFRGESNMEKGALNLPAGSIRAILALTISGVALATIILRGELPQGLSAIWGSVLGFYFGAKKGNT